MAQRKNIWITYEDVEDNFEITVRSADIYGFLIDRQEVERTGNGTVNLVICHPNSDDVVFSANTADAIERAKIMRTAMLFAIESAEFGEDDIVNIDLTPLQRGMLSHRDIVEMFSELSHKQWSHWTQYMLENMTPENVLRWRNLIGTSYSDLTVRQKESDREWAMKYLNILTEKL